MVTIEQLAKAALEGEALKLRALCQSFLSENSELVNCPAPRTNDHAVAAAAASIIELLALRRDQQPPSWTNSIGPIDAPMYLVQSAHTMKNLRALCDEQSPEPLKKRGFLAPPNYLESA